MNGGDVPPDLKLYEKSSLSGLGQGVWRCQMSAALRDDPDPGLLLSPATNQGASIPVSGGRWPRLLAAHMLFRLIQRVIRMSDEGFEFVLGRADTLDPFAKVAIVV